MPANRDAVDTIFAEYFSTVTPEEFRRELEEFSPGTSLVTSDTEPAPRDAVAPRQSPSSGTRLEKEIDNLKHRLAALEAEQKRLGKRLAARKHTRDRRQTQRRKVRVASKG